MAEVETTARPAVSELLTTPPRILGPFHPFMQKPMESGDLTAGGKAQGTILYMAGRVLTKSSRPVAGAGVEIWQANAHCRYTHPNDENTAPTRSRLFRCDDHRQ